MQRTPAPILVAFGEHRFPCILGDCDMKDTLICFVAMYDVEAAPHILVACVDHNDHMQTLVHVYLCILMHEGKPTWNWMFFLFPGDFLQVRVWTLESNVPT